jgi:hypothetical protein
MAEAICQEEACKKAVSSLQLSALIETLSACARRHTLCPSLGLPDTQCTLCSPRVKSDSVLSCRRVSV